MVDYPRSVDMMIHQDEGPVSMICDCVVVTLDTRWSTCRRRDITNVIHK